MKNVVVKLIKKQLKIASANTQLHISIAISTCNKGFWV